METNKQSQQAGDGSVQLQAKEINIYNCQSSVIDESRAREICREEYAIAKQNWTNEAIVIAESRVQRLEDALLPRLLNYDKTLSCFASPDFQFALRNAMVSAASSERENDYDMLAELLQHRVENANQKKSKLGISRAIDIVKDVDDDALFALTMYFEIAMLRPTSFSITKGLHVMNELLGTLLSHKSLPQGGDWIEHLDILSAVRIERTSSIKKLRQFLSEKFEYYFDKGIRVESEEWTQACSKFLQAGVPLKCFEDHPLKDNFKRIAVGPSPESFSISISRSDGTVVQMPLNDSQKEAFIYAKDISCAIEKPISEKMKDDFYSLWCSYANLKTAAEWWDSIGVAFRVTPIGIALANAFARTCCPMVPIIY